jgi:serine/threonine protein kinase
VVSLCPPFRPRTVSDQIRAIMFHIGIATQHPPLPDPSQMSELGIDFIEQCVTLDPTERPSAAELIQHPWLAEMVDAMVSPVHSTLLDSILTRQTSHGHHHDSGHGSSGGGSAYQSGGSAYQSGGSSTLVDSLDSATKNYEEEAYDENAEYFGDEGGAYAEDDGAGHNEDTSA